MLKRLLAGCMMLLLVACTETTTETYTIDFETNGGNSIATMELEAGEVITMPEEPVRSGYTFEAWYTDEALTGLFQSTEMPPFDITLYAKWDENQTNNDTTITVTFHSLGGSNIADMEYIPGDTMVQPNTPTRNGYQFLGWSMTETCNSIYHFGVAPIENLTLYACWQEDTNTTVDDITITFNSNGGSAVSTMTVTPGDNISAPSDPTRNGYSFGGWYTDSGQSNLFSWTTAPSSNTTLYAKWIADTVETYTVTFQTNGGSSVSSQTIEHGNPVTEPTDPTRSGYTFDGWYSDSNLNNAYSFGTTHTSNLTLYAKWTEDAIPTYTATFISNGGTTVSSQTINHGDSVNEPSDPTRSGYTFDGWYSDSSLTTLYNFGTTHTSNVTLYAKWTEIQTNTASDEVQTVLVSWDFVCSNNVCVYEYNSWQTYTFDFNSVIFSSELIDDDPSGDEQTKTQTIEINASWQADFYQRTDYLETYTTTIRVSGNASTGSYSVDSYSTNQGINESNAFDDAVDDINDLAAMLETILNEAGVTMSDLT